MSGGFNEREKDDRETAADTVPSMRVCAEMNRAMLDITGVSNSAGELNKAI